MTKEEKIRILTELLEAVEELNGEFQDGYDQLIKDCKKLIEETING